jgi:hypothetical protein
LAAWRWFQRHFSRAAVRIAFHIRDGDTKSAQLAGS